MELTNILDEVFLLTKLEKKNMGHLARQRILSKYTEEMYVNNQIESLKKVL
jgi:hypothetical protein